MTDLIILVSLLACGFVFGQLNEKAHYRSIRQREEQLRGLALIASKILPDEFMPCDVQLVAGNAVISVDFFKKFVATLRMLVGGRVRSYESLIDRARREALLRMRAQANEFGAQYVFNIKTETCSMYKGRRNSIGAVEVLAYGTAVRLRKKSPVESKPPVIPA